MTTMTPSPRPTSEPTLDLDGLDLAAIRAGALAGRRVAVLGFARSGIALARFFVDAGAVVTIYDGRPASELDDAVRSLEGRPVRLLAGPAVDPADAWRGCRARGDVAVGHARLSRRPSRASGPRSSRCGPPAGRRPQRAGDRVRTRSRPAALPGADDRDHRHEGQDHDVGAQPRAAGGRPDPSGDPRRQHRAPARRTPAGAPADDRVVIELSELQLPTLSRGTSVAVFTNVTSDHLDRHGHARGLPGGEAPVRRDGRSGRGARRQPRRPGDGRLRGPRRTADGGLPAGPTDARRPRHASMAGSSPTVSSAWPWPAVDRAGRARRRWPDPARRRAAHPRPAQRLERARGGRRGAAVRDPADAIRAAAGAFGGVEHRLETVGVVDGVRFVNDSQGTQPDAVIAALRAFDPPIVLIAGGRDKGIDLTDLGPVVAERVAAAVLIGESGPDSTAGSGRRAGPHRAGRDARGGRPPGGRDRRGARTPARRASRRTGHRADRPAQPGGGQLRHVRGLRGAWPRVQGARAAGRRVAEEGSR